MPTGKKPFQAVLGMLGRNGIPARFVHLAVEAGKHDGSFFMPGNRPQQFGGRRDRAGRACGDDRAFERRAREPVRFQPDQPAAALHRTHATEALKLGRQALADDGEKIENGEAMERKVAVKKLGEAVGAYLFGFEGIGKLGEAAGEAQRNCRRAADLLSKTLLRIARRPGFDECHQQQLAADR